LLLLCLGLGSIVAMPLAGAFAARVGCRRVLIAAAAVTCLVFPLLGTLASVRCSPRRLSRSALASARSTAHQRPGDHRRAGQWAGDDVGLSTRSTAWADSPAPARSAS